MNIHFTGLMLCTYCTSMEGISIILVKNFLPAEEKVRSKPCSKKRKQTTKKETLCSKNQILASQTGTVSVRKLNTHYIASFPEKHVVTCSSVLLMVFFVLDNRDL